MLKKAIGARKKVLKEETFLVKFKVPRKRVDAFDTKLKLGFVSTREAIKSLMRAILSDTSERS